MTPSPRASQVDQGWARPLNARKHHYFRGAMSLCNSMAFFGRDLEDDLEKLGDAPLKDDCVACWRKRKAELSE